MTYCLDPRAAAGGVTCSLQSGGSSGDTFNEEFDMLEEPRITLFCDTCHETFEFDLTSLAEGGWDDRNVKIDSEHYGWTWEGDDKHTCEECQRCEKCGGVSSECGCES